MLAKVLDAHAAVLRAPKVLGRQLGGNWTRFCCCSHIQPTNGHPSSQGRVVHVNKRGTGYPQRSDFRSENHWQLWYADDIFCGGVPVVYAWQLIHYDMMFKLKLYGLTWMIVHHYLHCNFPIGYPYRFLDTHCYILDIYSQLAVTSLPTNNDTSRFMNMLASPLPGLQNGVNFWSNLCFLSQVTRKADQLNLVVAVRHSIINLSYKFSACFFVATLARLGVRRGNIVWSARVSGSGAIDWCLPRLLLGSLSPPIYRLHVSNQVFHPAVQSHKERKGRFSTYSCIVDIFNMT